MALCQAEGSEELFRRYVFIGVRIHALCSARVNSTRIVLSRGSGTGAARCLIAPCPRRSLARYSQAQTPAGQDLLHKAFAPALSRDEPVAIQPTPTPPAGAISFEIVFFDVGQGDAASIIINGQRLLIDGGRSARTMRQRLEARGVPDLDAVLMTHPDAGHIGGLAGVPEMLAAEVVTDVEVLKVGHHGSNTSNTQAFLQDAAPDVAVISAGRTNQYGHPHEEVVSRLTVVGALLVYTDTSAADGSVVIGGGPGRRNTARNRPRTCRRRSLERHDRLDDEGERARPSSRTGKADPAKVRLPTRQTGEGNTPGTGTGGGSGRGLGGIGGSQGNNGFPSSSRVSRRRHQYSREGP